MPSPTAFPGPSPAPSPGPSRAPSPASSPAPSPGPSQARILFVARELSATPRDGGGLRRLALAEALTSVGSTAAFAFAAGPVPCEGLDAWAVASDPHAADQLQGADAAAAARGGRFPLGLGESRTAIADLRAFATAFGPDIVVASGPELLDHLEVLRPLAPRLVFDVDWAQSTGLHQLADADPHRARSLLWRHVLGDVVAVERRAFALVDQVWVCSDTERARLMIETGLDAVDVVTVPNAVDVTSYPTATRADRDALVFPARFDFWPNEEAARVLVEEVLPALPSASLTLVGVAPTAWMEALDDPRVHVTGHVPNVRPHLAAAGVMPVPVCAGSGTRLKVLEAFAAGVPVVSTEVGVGGFDLVDGEHYLRAETAAEFVGAIERLHDDALAARLCTNGRAWVEQHGSLAALHTAVGQALAAAV